MKKSKLAIASASIKTKTQSILGWALVLFALLGIVIYVMEKMWGMAFIMGAFLLLGSILLLLSYRTRKLLSLFRLYVSIISGESSISISELSRIAGGPEHIVMMNLQTMINKRFFSLAYIDHGKNSLVFPLTEKEFQKAKEEEENIQYLVVNCSVCGGNNRIAVGRNHNCMYCSNPIDRRKFE